MTNSEQAIREFAEKQFPLSKELKKEVLYNQMQQAKQNECLSDLTALIEEHYVSKDEHEAIAKMAEALKADMNAAKLELALMRKFILWTGENCQYYPDVNEWMYFESPMTQQYFKGTDELFNYWEENEQ